MKKRTYLDWLLLCAAVGAGLIYLGIQFVTGNSVNELLTACLFLAGAFCVQMMSCRLFSSPFWKRLPLILAVLYALWSIWLFCTAPAWRDATFAGLVFECLTPAAGCAAACFICKIKNF